MPTRLQALRTLAFSRQYGRCFYCSLPMVVEPQSGPGALRCTAEHLVARCDGGGDSEENIVAACAHCNSLRHRRAVSLASEPFKDLVRRRMAAGRWHSQSVRLAAVRTICRLTDLLFD